MGKSADFVRADTTAWGRDKRERALLRKRDDLMGSLSQNAEELIQALSVDID
jgi:hypothetical protein